MHIDVIDDHAAILDLKRNWEAVYAADSQAQYFLSWNWMSKWLNSAIKSWVVLAARPDPDAGDYVAFFPLRIRTSVMKSGALYNSFSVACEGLADYSGFICRPDAEAAAIPALAQHIKSSTWRNFSLAYFYVSDERAKLLVDEFPRSQFKMKKLPSTNNSLGVDNTVCPFVTLPGDWDGYLENQVGTSTRQKIRRFLRKVERSDDYRITIADTDTIERDVKTLMRLWEIKWGRQKGQSGAQMFSRIIHTMLIHCLEQNSLFMPVLWHGDVPVGVLGSLIDPEKRTMLFFVAGRDLRFKKLPSGLVLHAYSIRHAIDLGLTTYDFLRGNEPYKYSFGAQERHLKNFVIERKTSSKQLDPRTLDSAIKLAEKFQLAGHVVQAERGFRQILHNDPDHQEARRGLSQVLIGKGQQAAADQLLSGQADGRKLPST